MTNANVDMISKKDIELVGILNDEQDAVNEFSEYNSGYICDAIAEITDNYIPIYNNEVWENAGNISEYIERAIEEGLVATGGNIDLVSIFQAGYYVYYNEVLNNNIDAMIFNRVAKEVDNFLLTETKEYNLDEIISAIEDEVSSFDTNNQLEDLDDVVAEIIYRIKQDEFPVK